MRRSADIADLFVGKGFAIAVRLLCFLVLCIVLHAGVWPFHVPGNEVTWLQDGSGLQFGRHGTAYSNDAFRAVRTEDPECSIELWMQPASLESEGTIVAFDGATLGGTFEYEPAPEPSSLALGGLAIALLRRRSMSAKIGRKQ